MVVCPFIDEETNGSYLFANVLNGLNGLTIYSMITCNNFNYFTTYVDSMIFLELGVGKTGKRKQRKY
jgi:hypothetical protein